MEVVVRVEYADVTLRRLVFDSAYRSTVWSPLVVAAVRRRHQALVAASDRGDVARLRSLDLRAHDRDPNGRCSIKLADEVRLLLDFDSTAVDRVSVVAIVLADAREGVQ
jgi:plasmid maintenance system killer protein